MSNSIYDRQNEDTILHCLIAQRNEYALVKKRYHFKLIITLIYIAFLLLSSIVNCELLTAFVFLFSVFLSIVNKYADSFIRFHKKHASSMQQYVDVKLFSNAIGSNEMEWGELPSQTDIFETLSVFSNPDTVSVMNWYSDYSSLPNELQVFYCQRENARWSHRLYKSFFYIQSIILCLMIVPICFFVLVCNPSIISFICFLSWITPVLDYVYTMNKEIKSSIVKFENLNNECNQIEKKICSNTSLSTKHDLILLQYKIKECRETCYLIPDWFYNKTKFKYQYNEDFMARNITRK